MKLPEIFKMNKTAFSTVSLYDAPDEPAYWQTQTPEARLAAAELLRQITYGYQPAPRRLQRLLETVECEPR